MRDMHGRHNICACARSRSFVLAPGAEHCVLCATDRAIMDGTIASTVPVVVEENVHLQLCSSRCERPLIGVLVGRVNSNFPLLYILYCLSVDFQITSNSSYVLHFVPTPGAPDSPDPCS